MQGDQRGNLAPAKPRVVARTAPVRPVEPACQACPPSMAKVRRIASQGILGDLEGIREGWPEMGGLIPHS